jgi:hypothetical protein
MPAPLEKDICVCYYTGMHKYTDKEIELRGFLFGDGCCTIIRQHRTRKYHGKRVGEKVYSFTSYIPRINITQRDDNLALLHEVREMFGGHISRNHSVERQKDYPSRPTVYWQVQNNKTCGYIAKLMVDSKFNQAKKKSAKILYDFCSLHNKIGQRKFRPHEMKAMEKLHAAIRKANSYQGSNK